MVIAIVHNASLGILAKFEANDNVDATKQFIQSHPEYECDTIAEFMASYPVLAQSLLCVPLH